MPRHADPTEALLTRAEAEVTLLTKDVIRITREREEAYQTIFDMLLILGFDMDGDTAPHALIAGMGHRGFLDMAKLDAAEIRDDLLDDGEEDG